MTDSLVRVAILEDHQSIIDGYMYRLSMSPDVQVVGTAAYGEQLQPLLAQHTADVLLMDVHVPTSPENRNSFPVLHVIPSLLKDYPKLHILAISFLNQNTLIEALVEAGVSGYIFKNDQASIQQLAKIVIMAASGGVYFSQGAYRKLRDKAPLSTGSLLTLRQLEILSICAAYPDVTTSELAGRLGIASSTLRNLLSSAYLRLDVRTRAAAIAKAQQMGLLVGSSFIVQDGSES
jgi:two-component system nitrate/nitrite response regulator NarL